MRRKRIRGIKRKLRSVEKLLTDSTKQFPEDFHCEYCEIKLPANKDFINHLKQQGKHYIANLLIERATYLKQQKPNDMYKITVLLHIQNFWQSQLIIFENKAVYEEFFDRQQPWQSWKQFEDSPLKESFYNIVPNDFELKVYQETLIDDEWTEQNDLICIVER